MPIPALSETRAGYVALIGRPNAGKSTLLNQLVGEHLSIVTPKAQTTWQRVTGIVTEGGTQMIFLDTPGLLEPRDLLQKAMLGAALDAFSEADLVLAVVDASERPGTPHVRLRQVLQEARCPVHLVLNKMDLATPHEVSAWEAWAEGVAARVHQVTATSGEGIQELRSAMSSELPAGPFLYPEDDIASDSVRFFVGELVRETIFEQYHQEIPYSVFSRVVEFREEQDPVYIRVEIYFERKSQKGILLGKGGSAIKALGAQARRKVEHFLGRSVYLDLWVKPLASWRKSRAHLGRLGFHLPPDDEPTS